jgi:hypothetical protein
MTNLEDRLTQAIAKAMEEPASKKSGKSLTKIIIEKWDDIQAARDRGVTYTQIAEGMGKDITYAYFMTCIYRAKKKIEKNPGLIRNKSINTETETKAIIGNGAEIKHESNIKSAESSGMPRKIVGKAQAEADAQKEMFNKKPTN